MSGSVPQAANSREVIQMDTIDFGDVFAFTAVDISSREADVFLAPELTASYGYKFLKYSMQRRFDSFSELIQTDGESAFKEVFKQHVLEYTNRHRVSHPYMKNEQSFIESFNRTVRKECLDWNKDKAKEIPELTGYAEEFLNRYHYHKPYWSWNESATREKLVADFYGNISAGNANYSELFFSHFEYLLKIYQKN